MKAVPFQTLENAVMSTNAGFNLVTDSTFKLTKFSRKLMIFHLDITIFADVAQRAADGNFLRVPVLEGTVANEGDLFVLTQELLILPFAVPGVTETISDILTLVWRGYRKRFI
jgi:hypothetical protein